VDPFSVIIMGGLAVFVVALLLIGRYYPGSGADVLDWRPTRSPDVELQNELDDVSQMLEAQNEMRRRRGLPDRTEDDVTADTERHRRELDERVARWRAENQVPPSEDTADPGRR
jgi:hypothetical protein